jgi:hypothetical protein
MATKAQNGFGIFRTFIASYKRKVHLTWMLLPTQLVQRYMSNRKESLEGTARCHHLCSTSTPGMYHNITPVYVNSHNRFSTKRRHYSIEISDGPMFFGRPTITLSGFLLIDVGPNNVAVNHFCRKGRSPRFYG